MAAGMMMVKMIGNVLFGIRSIIVVQRGIINDPVQTVAGAYV